MAEEKMEESKQLRKKRKLLKGFLSLEFLCYFLFLWIDLCPWLLWDKMLVNQSYWSNGLKFFGIVVCFITSCWMDKLDDQKDGRLQAIALGWTVLADICLLLTQQYILGIGIFLLVQNLYLYRIQKNKTGLLKEEKMKQNLIKRIAFRGILSIVFLLMLGKKVRLDLEIVLVVFYFISFTDNLFLLLRFRKELRNGFFGYSFFLFGMILFYFCDINVGIFNLSSVLQTVPKAISNLVPFASVAMWLFYLPGQVLLTMSGGNFFCDIFTKK